MPGPGFPTDFAPPGASREARLFGLALIAALCIASPVEARPKSFDPVTVHLPSASAEAQIRRALEAGEHESAWRLAQRNLRKGEGLHRGRIQWLASDAALKLGKEEEALDLLGKLASSRHPLAAWARLRRAELLQRRQRASDAAAEAAKVTQSWTGAPSARVLEALALADAGRPEALAKLRSVAAEPLKNGEGARVLLALARLLEGNKAKEEALETYRRLLSKYPGSSACTEAEAGEKRLLEQMDGRQRAARTLKWEQRFERMRGRYEAKKYARAIEGFRALYDEAGSHKAERCRALLFIGKSHAHQRQRDEAIQSLEKLLAECVASDLRAEARYHIAKARAARREAERAIEHYDALAKEAPTHTLADDALLLAARLSFDRGDRAGGEKRLRHLIEAPPQADSRAEGMFLLAWQARRDQRFDEVLRLLEQVRDDEGPEGQQARASYWRARALVELGRSEEALSIYESIARQWPLRYYAQQALLRLSASGAARVEGLSRFWGKHANHGAARFPWESDYESEGFQRALELLRVGASDQALQEFTNLGWMRNEASESQRLLVALLLLHSGDAGEASRFARRALRDFLAQPPVGRVWHAWRAAYPDVFRPQVEQIAHREEVEAALLRAIAREESAFVPTAVSPAKAYGLMQFIEPTARRIASELRMPLRREQLFDPLVSLKLGGRFVAQLARRYQGHWGFVPPAYNAGPTATDRWLRNGDAKAFDEWVEDIGYEETRRYTRRVLQSYGIYRWMDQSRLLELPERLPALVAEQPESEEIRASEGRAAKSVDEAGLLDLEGVELGPEENVALP